MVFRDDLILFQVLELFVCCVKFGLEVFKLFIPFVGKGNKFCIKLFGISNLFLRLLIFVKKYFQSLLFCLYSLRFPASPFSILHLHA